MASRARRRNNPRPAKPGTAVAVRPKAEVAQHVQQPPVFVSTYGEPNAEKVLSSFQQYCELAYGGNAAIFGLLNMQMRLFSEARLGWLDGEKVLTFEPGLEKLETPWPNGTTGELLARMRQDAAIAGNAYVRDCGYRLERLRPDWVTIVSWITTDDFGHEVREVIGYWYEPEGDPERQSAWYPVDEVAHWAPIPDPMANWRGMSWFTPALKEINADRAMTEHREKFWRNAATPNIIIKYTGKITPSQKVGLVESIAAKHGGPANAGGTLVLDEGADPFIVGSKLSDAEFSDILAATENRMAVAAGVPALLVGLKEGLDAAAWSMYRQAIKAFADLFVRPDWRSACASLSVLVVADRPAGKRLWFDTTDIAALSEGEQETSSRMQVDAATVASLIQAGFTPESSVKAVKAGDITLLVHSGLVSVQLLPPGPQEETEPDPAADPAADPTADPNADKPAEDGEPTVARALALVLGDELAWARDQIERGWTKAEFAAAEAKGIVKRDSEGQFARKVGAVAKALLSGVDGALNGFDREPLRREARKRGIELPKGVSIDAIKDALWDHERTGVDDEIGLSGREKLRLELSRLTVPELKERARTNDIKGYSKLRKQELVDSVLAVEGNQVGDLPDDAPAMPELASPKYQAIGNVHLDKLREFSTREEGAEYLASILPGSRQAIAEDLGFKRSGRTHKTSDLILDAVFGAGADQSTLEKAQARQESINKARPVGATSAALLEFASNGATVEQLRKRMLNDLRMVQDGPNRERSALPALERMRAEIDAAASVEDVVAIARRVASEEGIDLIGEPNSDVPFDPDVHLELIEGNQLPKGTPVFVLKPGFRHRETGALLERPSVAKAAPAAAAPKPGLPAVGEVVQHKGGTYERLPGEPRRYRVITEDGRDISSTIQVHTAFDARVALDVDALDRESVAKAHASGSVDAQNAISGAWNYGTRDINGFKGASPAERAQIEAALTRWTSAKPSNSSAQTGMDREGDPDNTRISEPTVNAALRGVAEKTETVKQDIAALDRAFELSKTKKAITVYRGFSNGAHIVPPDQQGKDLKGLTWTTAGYTPTTGSRDAAEAYSGDPSVGGFAIRLNVPAGSPAIAIKDIPGGVDDEGEIVLPRDLSFRVVKDNGVQGEYGIRWLDVELVDSGERKPRGTADLASVLEQIAPMRANPQRGDRDRVAKLLEPLTAKELDEVILANGWQNAIRGTKEQKRRGLVESLVGFKLDSNAIMARKQPAPSTPTPVATAAKWSEVLGQLRNATADDEQKVRDLLDPLSKEDLNEIAGELETASTPKKSDSKATHIEVLVAGSVGFRQRAGAMGMGWVDQNPARRGPDPRGMLSATDGTFMDDADGLREGSVGGTFLDDQAPAPTRRRVAVAADPDAVAPVDSELASMPVLDLIAALSDVSADDEGKVRGALVGKSKTDLERIAREMRTVTNPSGQGKARLIEDIVMGTVGFRQRAEAVNPGGWGGRRSDKPLIENTWGGGGSREIHFHSDGAIGTAIARMGDDRHLEVEGDALGNVLGRLATDTVMGRTTAQQQLDRLKQLRDRLPAGGKARNELDFAVRELDAPNTPVPEVPASALLPLRQLVNDLHAVPMVRRETAKELDALVRLLDDFDQGKTGGMRLLGAVKELRNRRHESKEGKFEVDAAVDRAVRQLEEMQKADRRALYPAAQRSLGLAEIGELSRHLKDLHDQKDHGRRGVKDVVKAVLGAGSRASSDSRLAAGVASGIKIATPVGGGRNALVERVEFNDGTMAIRKKAVDDVQSRFDRAIDPRNEHGGTLSAKEQQDAEELAASVAQAVGVRVPAMHRTGDDDAYFELIDGQTALAHLFDTPGFRSSTIGESEEGIKLGFLDALINNADRHEENWMVDSQGRLVGIDHGQTFQQSFGTEDSYGTADPFSEHFSDNAGRWWPDNPMSPADVAVTRERLTALRPDFDRLGRGDWHDRMMHRLEGIAQRATGSTRRLT